MAAPGTRATLATEIIVMKRSILAAPAALALLVGLLPVGGNGVALAAQAGPTVEDVEAARRCATETRVAGYAFKEVRDSVRAGGTTRAQSLLSVAEDALRDARAACASDPDVSAQLDALAGEASGLRRSLGASQ
jgi:hypothetical protein